MKLRDVLIPLFALSLQALGACDPYNPDLGDEPFRCGTDEPRCPSDYVCDIRSETDQVCIRKDAPIPDRPDAMELPPDAIRFTCNNDSLIEPNNSVNMPTPTPIPELRDDYHLTGLAICPTTDVDIFRFRLDRTGKHIRVDMELNAAHGSLLLDILNSAGITIRSGQAVDGNPNLIRAIAPSMPADTYFVRVQAVPGVENNYSLHIITTGP